MVLLFDWAYSQVYFWPKLYDQEGIYNRSTFSPLPAYSFHLTNEGFHFPPPLSKIQSPLAMELSQISQTFYSLEKFCELLCSAQQENLSKRLGGSVFFYCTIYTYPLLELVVDLFLPGLGVRHLLLHHLGRLGALLGGLLENQISPDKKKLKHHPPLYQ